MPNQKHTALIVKIIMVVVLSSLLSYVLDVSDILDPPAKCVYLVRSDSGLSFDFSCYSKIVMYASVIFLIPVAILFARPKEWFAEATAELIDEEYERFTQLYFYHDIESVFGVKIDDLYSQDDFDKKYRKGISSGYRDSFQYGLTSDNQLKIINLSKKTDHICVSKEDLELRFSVFEYFKQNDKERKNSDFISSMCEFHKEVMRIDTLARYTWEDVIQFNDYLEDESPLRNWHWLIGDTTSALIITCFGDVFIEQADDEFYLLNSHKGEYTKFAENYDSFVDKVEELSFSNDLFKPDLMLDLRIANKELSGRQIYSLTKPPLLGGKYEVDNIELVDLYEHFKNYGQLHSLIQRKGLMNTTMH